jgi:CRP-like cAMP-binding protein
MLVSMKDVEEVHYAAGELLYQENHLDDDPCLFYVISGCVLLVYYL